MSVRLRMGIGWRLAVMGWLLGWTVGLAGGSVSPARAAVAAAADAAGEALIPAHDRKPAPEFTAIDAEGKTVSLSKYRGKVVLLDFWATWCGGCKQEIPWYIGFDRKYRTEGLAAIGVAMDDEGWKVVRPFLAKGFD